MNFKWNNYENDLKQKILFYVAQMKENESNMSLFLNNLDPYDLVNDYCDVFLYCASLNVENVCIYWIKNGYKNRYYKNNKTTLYYLLTTIKNKNIINEFFIYWKLNKTYFFKYFYDHFNYDDHYIFILFYFMNNNICPCKILNNNDHLLDYFLLKSKASCVCGECIAKVVNTNHNCDNIKSIIVEDKYIIGYVCQIIDCVSCLNHFLNKNTINIKKFIDIYNRKVQYKVLFYYSEIKKENGEFEDCIELENIENNEKFYKCTSNVSHYYKEKNWIKWINYNKNDNKCCVCRLDIDQNLYVNSDDKDVIYTYTRRDRLMKFNDSKIEENDKMFLTKFEG